MGKWSEWGRVPQEILQYGAVMYSNKTVQIGTTVL